MKQITKEKIEKYFLITEKAFKEAGKNINSKNKNQAKEILEMSENYISDAHHFFKKGDWVNAFAALNYSHGWLDSGARLRIFNVKDNQLFTVAD